MNALAPALLLLLLSGCLADAGHEAPAADPAEDRLATVADREPGAVSGTLSWSQAAAVVCPLYLESPASHSLGRLPSLEGAVALDLTFDWTPATPVFESAILSMDGYVRNGGTEVQDVPTATVRGGPGTTLHLEGDDLARFLDKDVYLYIEGPDCAPSSAPAKAGVDYEQLIAYSGAITFAPAP